MKIKNIYCLSAVLIPIMGFSVNSGHSTDENRASETNQFSQQEIEFKATVEKEGVTINGTELSTGSSWRSFIPFTKITEVWALTYKNFINFKKSLNKDGVCIGDQTILKEEDLQGIVYRENKEFIDVNFSYINLDSKAISRLNFKPLSLKEDIKGELIFIGSMLVAGYMASTLLD